MPVTEVVDAATTRREFLVMVAAAGVLAACGDGGGDPAPEAADGFPRTVGRGFAEVEIPRRPRRIVASADRDQLDVLLAMDVRPVLYGVSGDYDGAPPWIAPALLEGVEGAAMPGAFEPNLERISRARPDLIVDAWADATGHEALSRIAPTVEIKLETTDSWRDAQLLAGRATGLEAAAERAVAETDAEIAAQRRRLAGHDGTTVGVAYLESDAVVMLPGTEIGARIVADLGMDVLAPPGGASDRYSLEQLPDLLGEADVVLSYATGGVEAQESNPLFRALPAVQAGRYAVLPEDVATAAYQESSLSLRWAASRVADQLLAAATGSGRRLG